MEPPTVVNKKRDDWNLVRQLNSESQQELCALPLIVQPISVRTDTDRTIESHIIDKLPILNNYIFCNLNNEFLHLFKLQKGTDSVVSDIGNKEVVQVYTHIKIHPDVIVVTPISLNGEVKRWGYVQIDLTTGVTSATLTSTPKNTKYSKKELLENFAIGVTRTLVQLFSYISLALDRDEFPVTIQNNTHKSRTHRPHVSKDKQPWKRGDLASVVFMDTLPLTDVQPIEHKGGSHRSPVYHHRRGHFRTMRNDRYKKHKLFGQPVWYNPTWVGDDTVELSGATYKVLHPRQLNH